MSGFQKRSGLRRTVSTSPNWAGSQLRRASFHICNSTMYPLPSSAVFTCLFFCLPVCLSARITRKTHGKLSQIFGVCCLWSLLDPPLTALQYVMYFRFCGWRHVFIPWGLPESSRTLLEEVRQVAVPFGRQTTTVFGRVRLNTAPGGGQSLLSTIDAFPLKIEFHPVLELT